MIYMVDHIYTDPNTEPEWHAWYSGYLQKLLSVPGIHSAQRFKAVNHTPSRFLAMYSIDSADVYTSQGYKNIGGGGSQSARFHSHYQMWTRNLFEGAVSAPVVRDGERVLVFDRAEQMANVTNPDSRTVWLHAVGLHLTTNYRAFIVLGAKEAVPAIEGAFLYEPFTSVLGKS